MLDAWTNLRPVHGRDDGALLALGRRHCAVGVGLVTALVTAMGCAADSEGSELSAAKRAKIWADTAQETYANQVERTGEILAELRLHEEGQDEMSSELQTAMSGSGVAGTVSAERVVFALDLSRDDRDVRVALGEVEPAGATGTSIASAGVVQGKAWIPSADRLSPPEQRELQRIKSVLAVKAKKIRTSNDIFGEHGVCRDYLPPTLRKTAYYTGVGVIGRIAGPATNLANLTAGAGVSCEFMSKVSASQSGFFCYGSGDVSGQSSGLAASGGITYTFALSTGSSAGVVARNLIAGWSGTFHYGNIDADVLPIILATVVPPPVANFIKRFANATVSATFFASPAPDGRNVVASMVDTVRKDGRLALPEGVVAGVTLTLSAGVNIQQAPTSSATQKINPMPVSLSFGKAEYWPVSSFTRDKINQDKKSRVVRSFLKELSTMSENGEKIFSKVGILPQEVVLGGATESVAQFRARLNKHVTGDNAPAVHSPVVQGMLQKMSGLRTFGPFYMPNALFIDLTSSWMEHNVDCALAAQAR
ncbi:MAG: hypothetical protein ACPGUV_08745 [Polyangiales bacterium]